MLLVGFSVDYLAETRRSSSLDALQAKSRHEACSFCLIQCRILFRIARVGAGVSTGRVGARRLRFVMFVVMLLLRRSRALIGAGRARLITRTSRASRRTALAS